VKKVEVNKQRPESVIVHLICTVKILASRIGTQKLFKIYLGFGAVWAINLSTIFRSSWAGDDWPISQTPYWIQWRYGALTNWNIWTEAMFWNDQWMTGAGRFYPLTWIESRFVFSYLTELWQYKLYQVGMLFIAGLLMIVVCFLFSRSHTFAILALASLSLTVQFRRDFDPHLAFAVMLPSLLIKVFLAVIFAYLAGRESRKISGVLLGAMSGTIFFAAMSTYEFGFLLFPMLVISYLFGKMSKIVLQSRSQGLKFYIGWITDIKFLPILVSWIGYGIFVFGYLRPRASAISGSYVLGLSWSSVEVFLSQVLMGLPLVSLRDGDFGFTFFTISMGLLLLFLARSTFKQLFTSLASKTIKIDSQNIDSANSRHHAFLLILFSLTMILSPGFMMAMQPTWWNRADLKHTYLGVMITEFGTAIIIALILSLIVDLNIRTEFEKKKRK
jgi:hypothetical protein